MTYNSRVETNSLYIHWPFCRYRCDFCPFVALASHQDFMERYHKAICQEIEQFAALAKEKRDVDTVFLGGGTPSTWPDELLLDMSGKLKSVYHVKPLAEITIEVNPGTVRVDQLDMWKEIGINRLSIGVQCLNDDVLKGLNRMHTAQDVFRLLRAAEKVFDNISVDLILGLPGVLECEWKDLLKSVVSWPIGHVSIYFLTVHEDTKLYFKIQSQKVSLPFEDNLVELFNWSVDFLAQHGFDQYEISNFAKKGYVCRHNEVYWDRKPYKGFGLGACSFDGTTRFQNTKSLMPYLQGIERGECVEHFTETLTDKQVRLEKVMLGLRRPKGVLISEILDGLSQEQKDKVRKNVLFLKKNNFIVQKDGVIILNPYYLTIENEIVMRLLD